MSRIQNYRTLRPTLKLHRTVSILTCSDVKFLNMKWLFSLLENLVMIIARLFRTRFLACLVRMVPAYYCLLTQYADIPHTLVFV